MGGRRRVMQVGTTLQSSCAGPGAAVWGPAATCEGGDGKDAEVPGDRDLTDQWLSRDLKAEVALGIRPVGQGWTGWADRKARQGRRTAPCGSPGASPADGAGGAEFSARFCLVPAPTIPSGDGSDMDKAGDRSSLAESAPKKRPSALLCTQSDKWTERALLVTIATSWSQGLCPCPGSRCQTAAPGVTHSIPPENSRDVPRTPWVSSSKRGLLFLPQSAVCREPHRSWEMPFPGGATSPLSWPRLAHTFGLTGTHPA